MDSLCVVGVVEGFRSHSEFHELSPVREPCIATRWLRGVVIPVVRGAADEMDVESLHMKLGR
jgi:hypothetical protein